MKTVEQLVDEYKSLSPDERMLAFNKYTIKAIESCSKYDEDYASATSALGILTCAAIIADDRISDEELLLIYTGLKVSLGDIDLDECKKIAAETLEGKGDIRLAAAYLAETYLAMWSEDDKEDVIRLCIALCAMDGVISPKEIDWLKELAAAASL